MANDYFIGLCGHKSTPTSQNGLSDSCNSEAQLAPSSPSFFSPDPEVMVTFVVKALIESASVLYHPRWWKTNTETWGMVQTPWYRRQTLNFTFPRRNIDCDVCLSSSNRRPDRRGVSPCMNALLLLQASFNKPGFYHLCVTICTCHVLRGPRTTEVLRTPLCSEDSHQSHCFISQHPKLSFQPGSLTNSTFQAHHSLDVAYNMYYDSFFFFLFLRQDLAT